jgi:alpha-amylase
MYRKTLSILILFCLLLTFSIPGLSAAQEPISTEPIDRESFWWNDRVFYQVFVRSFYDSDGDGIGDLQGLIQQLDYLNDGDPSTTDDLGVTGLWLMPIMPSSSYHGYDVTDYYNINPEYGTLDDFKQLVDEAHARGMVVIMDLVLNHTSSQHPWFIESQNPNSEFADWYVWEDEDPGFRGPEGQRVWYPSGERYYYALFWSEMPDLNFTNPAVTLQMYDITRFWLEETRVDGFRLDAVKFMVEEGRALENTRSTHNWMQDYYEFVSSINPDSLLVGEIWSSTNLILPYIGDEVDIAFEFTLAETIVRAVNFGITITLRNAIQTVIDSYPPGQYATFLTNHDQNRLMSQLRGNEGAAKAAASLLLTLPGVPFIYYGEEIGMTGMKPDELIRTPMQWEANTDHAGFTTGEPWQPVNVNTAEVNVAAQDAHPASLLNQYRRLVQTRMANPALRTGDLTFVDSESGRVIAYLRHDDTQTVLVILNMGNRPEDDYALSLPEGMLDGVTSAELLLGGEGEIDAPEITAQGGFEGYAPLPELPPQDVVIIALR